MADDLTFVINPEGESASISLLLKSLEDITKLLSDVDRAIYGAKSQHQWLVRKLTSSAPTITLEPEMNGQNAAEVVGAGLRAVTTGTNQPPQYFTEQALVDLQKMRRLFGGRSKAKSITVLMNGQQTATIRPDISEKVRRILTAGYHNLGSLQGTLEAINVHGSPTVTIWERVSRSPVRCSIPKDTEWIDLSKSLLQKQVTVTGDIRYFINGTPRSISNIVSIEDATPDPNLPRAEFGSIPDSRVSSLGAAAWLSSVRGLSEE
jgi:hypothetical protein